eukprot:TRINITY_DN17174_c1_g1_i1.p1 TRINITY_DN17174_c1_g1~~TRINITY_DN17174_c1_g1_i1.p1  ORF type:complete len:149 (-),score=36.71 TRINITY_DN17174_c1_g1_i1:135-581(-)
MALEGFETGRSEASEISVSEASVASLKDDFPEKKVSPSAHRAIRSFQWLWQPWFRSKAPAKPGPSKELVQAIKDHARHDIRGGRKVPHELALELGIRGASSPDASPSSSKPQRRNVLAETAKAKAKSASQKKDLTPVRSPLSWADNTL